MSRSRRRPLYWFLSAAAWAIFVPFAGRSEEIASSRTVVSGRLHHLRIEGPREWNEFPESAEAEHLEVKFTASKNATETTLLLRQQDVKQPWRIRLNGRDVGRLTIDENDMVVAFPIAADGLIDGENVLRIEQIPRSRETDDIRVGEITLDLRPKSEAFAEAQVEIEVLDADTEKTTPGRITIVGRSGAL